MKPVVAPHTPPSTGAWNAPHVPGVRGWLWRNGQDLRLFDSEPRLWLHLDDGRVLVFRFRGIVLGDARIIEPLVQAVADDLTGERYQFELAGLDVPSGVRVQVLYAAPILPLSKHNSAPFSQFIRRDMLDFMRTLDAETLDLLGRLDSHRFYASVRNYNRLAALPPLQHQRRMQALHRFPALLAPILLTAHHSINLMDGKRHAWRYPAPDVEQAIDAAQNLVGALTTQYGISKGLVRSKLNADFWEMDDGRKRAVLRFLDTLPANKRPASAEELIREWPRLQAYLLFFGEDAQGIPRAPESPEVHRGAFRLGWQETWHYCDQHAPNFHHALHDTRDFLAVASALAAQWLKIQRPLVMERLAEAWLALYGLSGLLRASSRWHRLRPPPSAGFIDRNLPALLGAWHEGKHEAHELLSYSALVEEGEAMRHCVADYWQACVQGERMFSLLLSDGERATAEYVPDQHPHDAFDVLYRLEQLRGSCNAEVSAAMQHFAEQLETQLNQDALKPQRSAALGLQQIWANDQAAPRQSWLDPRSQQELLAVLAWLEHAPAEADVWLRAHVAGFAYHAGNDADFLPTEGETLTLQREPENPHDALAVRIDWQGRKLGYIPRPANAEIARALDAGVMLAAKIQRFDAKAELWRRLEFVVHDPSAGRA
ncbi:MAG TPA: HIRAN domain-containing protein [Halothiobacillus sp.]|nr:HIRAN domain-containing protein [Halothiobacillus sp.]